MSKTRPEWSQEITKRADELVALRRDFHRHPELSHQERRTAEIIAERLHAANLDVREGVGGTGVVGVLHGDRPGPTIAWRGERRCPGRPSSSSSPPRKCWAARAR